MQKKLLAVLMVLVLCVSMLAGCGEGTSGSEETEGKTQASTQTGTENQTLGENDITEAVVQDPVTLKVWVPENLRVDWDNNKMTEWLEEQANVDLVFQVLSSADYDEKVNMELTVGDVSQLPDIVLGSFKNDKVWKYAQAETILPLTEYYNDSELAKNINESMEKCGYNYVDEIVAADGNIYGVAYYNQSYGNEYPEKMWIYKPWLDALGEDIPTTTEEFYQLLKKVSETDLNGNGKKDEIPLAGASEHVDYDGYIEYLMNAFVYAGGTDYRVFDDNGVASAAFATEEWKDGLAYVSTLFDENLILAESLTMNKDQFIALLNTEDQTVFAFTSTSPSKSNRSADYIGIGSLTGPEGVNWATFEPSSARVAFLVTANCDNPEAAFRVGDLMSSEKIGISQRWGWEGIDWDYAENVNNLSSYQASVEGWDVSIVAYDDKNFWSGSEVQYSSWLQKGPYVRSYGIANGLGVAAGAASNTVINEANTLYQTEARHPKYSPKVLNFTDEEAERISDIAASLKDYVDEFKAGVLTGNINLDAEWDNYLKELETIGLEDWLDVLTDAFARMYK